MTVINATLTPILGRAKTQLRGHLDDGTRYVRAKITIPTGTTYAQADKVRLIGPYAQDFYEVYGYRFIKQVLCGMIGFPSLSTGLVKLRWDAINQKASLRMVGNGGTPAPAGPIDEAELTDAFNIAAGPCTAEATLFF